MEGTLEAEYKVGREMIQIWRWGINDYSANFINQDCSTRGTLLEVMRDICEAYNPQLLSPL